MEVDVIKLLLSLYLVLLFIVFLILLIQERHEAKRYLEDKISNLIYHRIIKRCFHPARVLIALIPVFILVLFSENYILNFIYTSIFFGGAWLAWETVRLKEEQVTANQLKIREGLPSLELYFRQNFKDESREEEIKWQEGIKIEVHRDLLRVRNSGRSQAYNVEVIHEDCIFAEDEKAKFTHRCKFRFRESTPFLSSNGDEKTLEPYREGDVPIFRKEDNAVMHRRSDVVTFHIIKDTLDLQKKKDIIFLIKCRNIECTLLFFIFRIYKDEEGGILVNFVKYGKDEDGKIDIIKAREIYEKNN